MMIVMPAFAIGSQRHPPAVSRIVSSLKIAITELMRRAIYQPSAVIDDYESGKDSPEYKRPAADSIQYYRQDYLEWKKYLLRNW